jgi:hypothetical protein
MRTTDFSTLLYRWMQLAGLDRTTITSLNFSTFRDFSNGRLEVMWKSDLWPDLIRITTPPGNTVTTDGYGVRSYQLDNTVGEVLGVYDQNPRLTTRARLLKYFLYEDTTGRYVNLMENTTPIFIEYRIVKSDLFGDLYDNTISYQVGSQIYFDPSCATGSYIPSSGILSQGNFYTCINASVGFSPITAPQNWQIVPIPYFMGEYLIRSCLADYLRSEGQFEQSQLAESDAEGARELEVDRVLRQEGQIPRLNMFTY